MVEYKFAELENDIVEQIQELEQNIKSKKGESVTLIAYSPQGEDSEQSKE